MRMMILALLLVAGPAPARAPSPPGPPACAASQYRQLDFWVGDWDVFDTARGFKAGTSRIEKVMNGCSIKESYDAPNAPSGPYAGTSYSSYDAKDGKWRQFYVDVKGNASLYVGGMEGADMVLVAPVRSGVQRMTYRPHPDGSVEQIGLISTDRGKSWGPAYDLIYRRKQGL